MISQGFRTYDIEADDFPMTFNASTDASKLPDLAPVTFFFQDVATGAITKKKRSGGSLQHRLLARHSLSRRESRR
jgi:hypothetical protein